MRGGDPTCIRFEAGGCESGGCNGVLCRLHGRICVDPALWRGRTSLRLGVVAAAVAARTVEEGTTSNVAPGVALAPPTHRTSVSVSLLLSHAGHGNRASSTMVLCVWASCVQGM